MRKLTTTLAFPLVLLFLLFSCKKEVITPTSAEKTAEELEKTIEEQNVSRVYAFDYPGTGWTSLSTSIGDKWAFSNGYITISGYSPRNSWNLAYLHSFTVGNVALSDGTHANALLLYFK